jgi:hypothetical protein
MDQLDPQWLRAEVDRCWMRVPALLTVTLASVSRKDIHNWSDRGFLTFVEVDDGTLGHRRYGLASALQATILERLRHGASLVVANKISMIALDRMRERAALGADYVATHDPADPHFLVYTVGPAMRVEAAFIRPRDIAEELLSDPPNPPGHGILGPGGAGVEQRVLAIDGLIAEQVCSYVEELRSLETYEKLFGEEGEGPAS